MKAELATAKYLTEIMQYDSHIPSVRLVECINRGQVYVLKDGDRIVGVLRFSLFWQTVPFLDLIYLDEACRNKGYGTYMMNRWQEDMKCAGYMYIMTSTQADETAWHFYQKLGFKKTGSFLPPGQDADEWIYVKIL